MEDSFFLATEINQEFVMELRIENVIDLLSYQIYIRWDPEIMELVENPSRGDFLKDSILDAQSPKEGEIAASCVSFSTTGFDGSGTLISFTFRVKTQTIESIIEFSETILQNSDGGQIAHLTENGRITLNLGEIPIAEAGADSIINEGEQILFDGSLSTNPKNETLQCFWNFENKKIENNKIVLETVELLGIETSTVFEIPGNYTVKLTIQNNEGINSTDKLNVQVLDVTPPIIKITSDPISANVMEGELIRFIPTECFDPEGGTIINFAWDFGDNEEKNTPNPEQTKIYQNAGSYTVIVTAEDSSGNKDSDSIVVTVQSKYSQANLNLPPLVIGILVIITSLVLGGSAFWLRKTEKEQSF